MQKTTATTASADICTTIRPADSIDPFEGLDLDEICVSPKQFSTTPVDHATTTEPQTALFGLNPLDGESMKGLTVPPEMLFATSGPPLQSSSQPSEKDLATPQQEEGQPSQDTGANENTPLSTEMSHPPLQPQNAHIDPLIKRAYHYAELTQIREKVFASLQESGGNTLLIASPFDNTGSSLLAAALGYNTACSCQKSVLLVDCNMRRAGLHTFFHLPQSYGFTDLVQDNLPWQAVVKKTGVNNLSMITAGEECKDFAKYLRYSHIPQLIQAIRYHYNLIIFDTSPVLMRNRNNVNITSLTSEVDYFLLLTKQPGTTKDNLTEVRDIVEAGNGTIDGIVLNEHKPGKKPKPFSG